MEKPTFGLVQVFWGDGKGKTTSALGAALRACGSGFNVHLIQFMKNGSDSSEFSLPGEISSLDRFDNGSRGRFNNRISRRNPRASHMGGSYDNRDRSFGHKRRFNDPRSSREEGENRKFGESRNSGSRFGNRGNNNRSRSCSGRSISGFRRR